MMDMIVFASPSTAPLVITAPLRLLRALVAAFSRQRARRLQLQQLERLLDAETRLLRDIGVSRNDVLAAIDRLRELRCSAAPEPAAKIPSMQSLSSPDGFPPAGARVAPSKG